MKRLAALYHRLNTLENRWALFVCLVVILLIVLTASQSPLWIYQGF
jgi:hypothetical protein